MTPPELHAKRAAAVTAAIAEMSDIACAHRRAIIDLGVAERRVGYFNEWLTQTLARCNRAEARAREAEGRADATEFVNRRMAGELRALRHRLAQAQVPV